MILEKALLAGGCFWGLQAKLKAIPGVYNTVAVYTGGSTENPSYRDVCCKDTGHLEAVEMEFDPETIAFKDLLEAFFKAHNPSSCDAFGKQYRSTIFYFNQEQKAIAESLVAALKSSGTYDAPIRTQICEASITYPAEDYHQDYYEKHNVHSEDGCCRKKS